MKLQTILMLVCVALMTVFTMRSISHAEGKTFTGVVPFVTSSGYLGLFSQSDGKIYVYDSNFSKCVFEGRLDDLGRDIAQIRGSK